jgi:hypothetical protein
MACEKVTIDTRKYGDLITSLIENPGKTGACDWGNVLGRSAVWSSCPSQFLGPDAVRDAPHRRRSRSMSGQRRRNACRRSRLRPNDDQLMWDLLSPRLPRFHRIEGEGSPTRSNPMRHRQHRRNACNLADRDGLTLLVNPHGSKWWRLRHRIGGREKMLSVGVYPVPLRHARGKREHSEVDRERSAIRRCFHRRPGDPAECSGVS